MASNKNKSDNPIISLVLSCYGVADYLPEMIKSILSQTYIYNNSKHSVSNSKEIEIILVEDCSKDNNRTLSLCTEYAKKYSNIKLYKQKTNKGLSACRNLGIKRSHGKYISFPDPDDVMCNGLIDAYMSALEEYNYDLISSGLIERHFDSDSQLILEKEIILKDKSINGKTNIAKESIELEKKICLGYAWNKLYKTSIIKDNNLCFAENLEFIEDILFNIIYLRHCKSVKTVYQPSIIYNRRLKSKSSITSNYEPQYFELHYLRIEALLNYWKEASVLDGYALEVLANLYLRYALSALWRNKDKKAKMNYRKQKQWLKDFFNLDLSKLLIPYAKSDSFTNKVTFALFKNKNISALLKEASVIKFVNNNMDKSLIRLRQSR